MFKSLRPEFLFQLLLLASFVAGSSGCDSGPAPSRVSDDQMRNLIDSALESATARPVAGKDGKRQYVLRVSFSPDLHGLRLPHGLNILGRKKPRTGAVIYDDGSGFDEYAGDGVYTGLISDACLPTPDKPSDRAGKDLVLSCKLKIVSPGTECGEWGQCPETLHRSLFWGLIEYDTDTLFCFCLDECEIGNK